MNEEVLKFYKELTNYIVGGISCDCVLTGLNLDFGSVEQAVTLQIKTHAGTEIDIYINGQEKSEKLFDKIKELLD